MEEQRALCGVERFDLMQVHNLLSWEGHLETLKQWKGEGRLHYLGITTSHGSRHDEMEEVMKSHPLDFVQFTYNVLDREAEARLLPLAADRGQEVIVNRPFRQTALIRQVQGHPLPDWAAAFGPASWTQFPLKFVISHPSVPFVIPAPSPSVHLPANTGQLKQERSL